MDDLRVVVDVEAFVVAGRNHYLAILDKDIPVAIDRIAVSYGENLRGTGRLAAAEVDQNR
jgi:hypothetical protein